MRAVDIIARKRDGHSLTTEEIEWFIGEFTRGAIPDQIRKDVLAWVGCIAGALDENDYRAKLSAAGFEAVSVEPTRVYKVDDAREFLISKGFDVDAMAKQVDGKFMSAFVRATKSMAATPRRGCCG